ncbi:MULTISPECIES: lipopolysaccharide biosynthesis protein [Marinobacter]|uniref:lipopolysaccharide biosynthesis protein n=1 Tax=Marinobacter TaxID=2742 RepID=UPI001B0995CC|nr:oligosaccharide flippase family protein [Marinobacter sp.]MBO6810494.1 oligosaccharide flippase family protein [Marinobacter sp.]MBO6874834.1 oligosaccharide flippase family protein [Marinobacter sp.]
MNQVLIRLTNLGLRGTTLVSKFLLIFMLARFLEPADLGLYGLITVTISYALYLVGFDFYIFTTREILKAAPEKRGQLLKSQLALSLILYAIFLPLTMGLFSLGLLPWWLLPWFLALLVLEHITQELNRILVALQRQLIASWVLFFRAGAWCLAVVAIMYLNEASQHLTTVLTGWIAGSSVGLLIGVAVLWKIPMGGWLKAVDWGWLKKGLKIALPMLIATLALRGIYTVDRYWFEALAGLDVLGAYVLFIGMCMALLGFMDAGVFTFLYPAMISAHANDNAADFRKKFRQLAWQTVVLTGLFSACAWLAVGPLLQWLDKPLYLEKINLFGWLLLANGLFVVGMIPHYGLYARGNDKPLIISHIAGLLVFLASTAFFAPVFAELAVPFGLISAFVFIMAWKTLQFYRLTPANWR